MFSQISSPSPSLAMSVSVTCPASRVTSPVTHAVRYDPGKPVAGGELIEANMIQHPVQVGGEEGEDPGEEQNQLVTRVLSYVL